MHGMHVHSRWIATKSLRQPIESHPFFSQTLSTTNPIRSIFRLFCSPLHLIFDYKIRENVKWPNNTGIRVGEKTASNSGRTFKSWNFFTTDSGVLLPLPLGKGENACVNKCQNPMLFRQSGTTKQLSRTKETWRSKRKIWIKLLKIPPFVGMQCWIYIRCSWRMDQWKTVCNKIVSNVTRFYFVSKRINLHSKPITQCKQTVKNSRPHAYSSWLPVLFSLAVSIKLRGTIFNDFRPSAILCELVLFFGTFVSKKMQVFRPICASSQLHSSSSFTLKLWLQDAWINKLLKQP